jgi:Reverse transcriptase (RNA-dependent DNA polymerase)/Endonuclease-reverse transcriptase
MKFSRKCSINACLPTKLCNSCCTYCNFDIDCKYSSVLCYDDADLCSTSVCKYHNSNNVCNCHDSNVCNCHDSNNVCNGHDSKNVCKNYDTASDLEGCSSKANHVNIQSDPHTTRMSCVKKSLTYLLLNCQSLKNKVIPFQTLLETHQPDIVFGTESWLDESIPNSFCFPDNYEVFRRDRKGLGGGVFICIHNSLHASLHATSEKSEILWVDLMLPDNSILKLAVVYKPDRDLEPLSELCSEIEKLQLEKNPKLQVIIGGDLNLPNANWNNPIRDSQCVVTQKLVELLDQGMTQIVDKPTRVTQHSSNILDVILTNHPFKMHDLSIEDGISDHKAVLGIIQTKHEMSMPNNRKIFLFHKADTNMFKTELQNSLQSFRINCLSSKNISDILKNFYDILTSSAEKCVPQKLCKKSTDPPWYNKDIRLLKKKMRTQHARFKTTHSSVDYANYSNSRQTLNLMKRKAEQTFLTKDLGDMLKSSPKRYWTFVKYKTKGSFSSISGLQNGKGKLITDPVGKATILNEQFQSVFVKNGGEKLPDCPKRTDKTFSIKDLCVTSEGIRKLIVSLNNFKASGPDSISPRLLKLAPQELSEYLLMIFQKCIDLKEIPTQWKVANISPIFKKGSKTNAENYRPISLTSVVCKIFEHIITSNIATYLEQNSLFNPDQFGFRKNRSCEFQLQRVCQDLSFLLDGGGEADLIFLDFAKAFDKVSHDFLLHKLSSYGLDQDTVDLVKSFLSNRTQKVVVDGQESSAIPVTSGVPQGSVLGPLLFLLYINDLPDNVKSQFRLFADDSLLYRKIKSPEDHIQLQKDLDEVVKWCVKWKMCLNLDKCEYMQMTSKREPSQNQYIISNQVLNKVSSYKYLGLNITENLNWNLHVNSLIAKANKILYVTKLSFSKASRPVKEAAYKAIVRPLLEYSSSVWDPHQAGLTHSVEMVQRRAARFCLGRYRKMDSVSDMLEELQWESLELRRKADRLKNFLRAYKGEDGLQDITSHIRYAPNDRLRHVHAYRVGYINCHKDVGRYSFLPRTIKDWNSLPDTLLSAENFDDPSKFREAIIMK